MSHKISNYKMPKKGCISDDRGANLAFFLVENTGSCLGEWSGRMRAKDQRTLYGKTLGKGFLIINGDKETVIYTIKVDFGHDIYDSHYTWADLIKE